MRLTRVARGRACATLVARAVCAARAGLPTQGLADEAPLFPIRHPVLCVPVFYVDLHDIVETPRKISRNKMKATLKATTTKRGFHVSRPPATSLGSATDLIKRATGSSVPTFTRYAYERRDELGRIDERSVTPAPALVAGGIVVRDD